MYWVANFIYNSQLFILW